MKKAPVTMSAKTLRLVGTLNREYQRIRDKENDPKCKIIDVGRRLSLEMRLCDSVREDVACQS